MFFRQIWNVRRVDAISGDLRKGFQFLLPLGQMHRPIKKPVTMRLDADVIAWLKEDGRGYQTKANALLRREMLRSYEQKKGPERASNSGTGKGTKSTRSR